MKVSVVGQIQSGKSTLAVALSRLVELHAGSILIDGIDISEMDLNDLRRNITFISQDAILFSGTVRDNIDPCNKHSDDELESMLLKVGLQNLFIAQERDTFTPEIAPRHKNRLAFDDSGEKT